MSFTLLRDKNIAVNKKNTFFMKEYHRGERLILNTYACKYITYQILMNAMLKNKIESRKIREVRERDILT